MAFSPDGTLLATADTLGAVRIWDAATGTAQAALTGHAHVLFAMAFSPDGAWYLSAVRRRPV